MSASLVGSEMCIRDSAGTSGLRTAAWSAAPSAGRAAPASAAADPHAQTCLLYTSDAADDM
eukprot:8597202-Alexandrium_andersonii.AAC.1